MLAIFGGKLHPERVSASTSDVFRIDWQQGEHSRIPGIDPLWYVLPASGGPGQGCLTKKCYLQDVEPLPVPGQRTRWPEGNHIFKICRAR
jgi:hypothetical protein